MEVETSFEVRRALLFYKIQFLRVVDAYIRVERITLQIGRDRDAQGMASVSNAGKQLLVSDANFVLAFLAEDSYLRMNVNNKILILFAHKNESE